MDLKRPGGYSKSATDTETILFKSEGNSAAN